MDVNEVLQKATDAITVSRVYGEPYEKDGLTVIPAARVSGGGEEGRARTRRAATGPVAASASTAARRVPTSSATVTSPGARPSTRTASLRSSAWSSGPGWSAVLGSSGLAPRRTSRTDPRGAKRERVRARPLIVVRPGNQ